MTPRIRLVFVCFVLAYGGTACTPKLVGPTVPSGYYFSLQASNTLIWLGPLDAALAALLPTSAQLSVRVQDAEGRPVDGVPVTFEVEPGWRQSASLSPPQAITSNGIARTVFEAQTTGVVRVTARVDNATQETRITISNPNLSRPGADD